MVQIQENAELSEEVKDTFDWLFGAESYDAFEEIIKVIGIDEARKAIRQSSDMGARARITAWMGRAKGVVKKPRVQPPKVVNSPPPLKFIQADDFSRDQIVAKLKEALRQCFRKAAKITDDAVDYVSAISAQDLSLISDKKKLCLILNNLRYIQENLDIDF